MSDDGSWDGVIKHLMDRVVIFIDFKTSLTKLNIVQHFKNYR